MAKMVEQQVPKMKRQKAICSIRVWPPRHEVSERIGKTRMIMRMIMIRP